MSGQRPSRVGLRHVEWVAERLSDRDWSIIADLDRVRLLTGSQIERLHFSSLSGRSRSVVRWRVVKRLVDWRVLLPFDRKIGGAARGSAGLTYVLDTAGVTLAQIRATADNQLRRRPGMPGERFVRHALMVSEIYVQLVEATRVSDAVLVNYLGEPDAWLPNGLGGWLKPDSYVVLASPLVEDHWAIEVDKSTEHLPTLKRKFETYVDFMRRGQRGLDGVMPRVLVTVLDDKRCDAINRLIRSFPTSTQDIFHVATERDAVADLLRTLHAEM